MIDILKARINQGYQTINDIRNATPPEPFRGLPEISNVNCPQGCRKCLNVCPTDAISLDPVGIDLKRCILCPECVIACPEKKIKFTQNINLSSTDLESMVITSENKIPKIVPDKRILKIFRKSLKLRSVSAAGCNACELELNALGNVNFDMGRFGIEFVASPRHADGVVITGPISTNMAYATINTIKAVADPKIIILSGACAMSGGPFHKSSALTRDFLNNLKIDIYIGGCPPHPLTFLNAVLDYLER